jgi:hypothetical protein
LAEDHVKTSVVCNIPIFNGKTFEANTRVRVTFNFYGILTYLYNIYSTIEFPNAETCGKQECERFANSEHYRGFEYSVAQRCTCLFDKDEAPAVPNDESDPKYVTRIDNGIGTVTGKCSIC